MPVFGSHDWTLVVLSVLVATTASYTALDLAGRVRQSSKWAATAWLGAAAVGMGGGVWAMHFIGMLAFSVPGMAVEYDLSLTLISLAAPVAVTAISFFLLARLRPGPGVLAVAGIVMGLGIVAMHYIGMAAMRMPMGLSYDRIWGAASVLIALGASTAALWLAFKNTRLVEKLGASVAMGIAIAGMHYAAMQGARFTPHIGVMTAHVDVDQTRLALAIAAITFLILFMAIIAAMF